MTANSHGVLESMKAAPIGVRIALGAVWVGAVGAGIMAVWKGDWLSGVFYLAILGHLTWIVSASQRGLTPSGREKVAMWAGSILILALSVLMVTQRFAS